MKNPIWILIIVVFSLLSIPARYYYSSKKDNSDFIGWKGEANSKDPDCIKMILSIEKYAKKYNIPRRFALGIAYTETSYRGPMDWEYNPKRISEAGALGPMQIMPATADMIWKKKIPKSKLLSDVDFNVHTSMILLNKLYKQHKDWKVVFGCYNTGRPCINEYSEKVYNFNPKDI